MMVVIVKRAAAYIMPNRRQIIASLPVALATAAGTGPDAFAQIREGTPPMTIEQIKQSLVGDWTSIAPEIRPSALKNPDGTLKPFYLTRDFKALPGDRFELVILNAADPQAKIPLTRIAIKGHMHWRGDHPIAAGAQKVDFIADEAYEVTPLLQGFADLLNQVASQGYETWQVGRTQSVFGKAFAPFGLTADKHFMEYDLVYLAHGLLFWGARNIDGRGFDTEQNRPTNLQIPLVRK